MCARRAWYRHPHGTFTRPQPPPWWATRRRLSPRQSRAATTRGHRQAPTGGWRQAPRASLGAPRVRTPSRGRLHGSAPSTLVVSHVGSAAHLGGRGTRRPMRGGHPPTPPVTTAVGRQGTTRQRSRLPQTPETSSAPPAAVGVFFARICSFPRGLGMPTRPRW